MGAVRTLVFCGLVWASVCGVVDAGELRTWVDNRGNQVPGELVNVTADQMVVLLVEGAEVTIPLKVFSTSDQKYLREQLPAEKQEATESEEPAETTSSEEPSLTQPKEEEPTPETNVTDVPEPPTDDETIEYYCTNCDGELSASTGVGDHCPHCDILIEYEEDADGNVVAGERLPWYGRLLARVLVFGVIFVASTAWKFRHLIPLG